MLSVNKDDLKGMLNATNKKIGDLKAELFTSELEIKALCQKRDGTEKSIKKQENKSRAIQRALILVQGIPPKISQMRNRLLRTMERSAREDITVVESKNLKTKIETLKAELQKACPHPFLYEEPGYKGDYAHDYENRHPCVRYCVVCGFSEDTYKSIETETSDLCLQVEYQFKTLAPDDKRIIEDQPWTSQGRQRVNVWIPLGAVLKPFEDSAVGGINS